MYGASSYYFAKNVVSLMTNWLYPFVLTILTIWFIGLPVLNFGVFVSWYIDLLLISLVASSMAMTITCVFPESNKATNIGNLFIIMANCGAGFNANVKSVPFARFLGWVSPERYACELIMLKLLDGKNYEAS